MDIEAKTIIRADRETVWKAMTDKENIRNIIPGIEKVEVHEKPPSGVVGLEWSETRTLFGKSATATMRITEASDLAWYKTRCEVPGSIYVSTYDLKPVSAGTELTVRFNWRTTTFGAKTVLFLMGWLLKGITRKAMDKDLAEIKASLESKAVKAVS